jgi:hypothetical protein
VILEHYASGPLVTINSAAQGAPSSKPRGLWVSVKGADDWPSWCRGEEFRLGTLAVCHRITLADTANILWIDQPWKIDDLDLKYAVNPGARPSYEMDWARMALHWDGIIIAPYQWSRRLDGPSWYYGWDCASGCIWNANAIASFEVMEAEAA